jgi:hypothetical protein
MVDDHGDDQAAPNPQPKEIKYEMQQDEDDTEM